MHARRTSIPTRRRRVARRKWRASFRAGGSGRSPDFKCAQARASGNYYRSRYAEELFNHLAAKEGLEWLAFSRGTAERDSPDNVGSISRFAREALEAKGIVPKASTDALRGRVAASLRVDRTWDEHVGRVLLGHS